MIINAATITGPHHRKHNENNQDALFYQQEEDFTVIAAADGAGSLKNSAIGANLAAQISVEEALESLLNSETIEQSLKNGIERAREELMSQDNWKDLGCTLSLATHSPDGWGVGIVGDAFAVVSKNISEHQLIHREPDSEYANITKLLTSNNYDPLYISGDDSIIAISVATDGLTNFSVKIASNEASGSFWTPLIKRSSENKMNVEAFLEYLNKKEMLYDDTTLVIASAV